MKKLLILAIILIAAVPLYTKAAGSLIKGESFSSIYYVGDDGKRYVFPNDKTFFSWYEDFSTLTTVSDSELASFPIGGNVTYRPGKKLVKVQTDPKVYAVDKNGTLRWVATEKLAVELYGADWAKQVDDVPDIFFTNYKTGNPITVATDFIPGSVLTAAVSIYEDKKVVGGAVEPVVAPVVPVTPPVVPPVVEPVIEPVQPVIEPIQPIVENLEVFVGERVAEYQRNRGFVDMVISSSCNTWDETPGNQNIAVKRAVISIHNNSYLEEVTVMKIDFSIISNVSNSQMQSDLLKGKRIIITLPRPASGSCSAIDTLIYDGVLPDDLHLSADTNIPLGKWGSFYVANLNFYLFDLDTNGTAVKITSLSGDKPFTITDQER